VKSLRADPYSGFDKEDAVEGYRVQTDAGIGITRTILVCDHDWVSHVEVSMSLWGRRIGKFEARRVHVECFADTYLEMTHFLL